MGYALTLTYSTDLLLQILWNVGIFFIPRINLLRKLKPIVDQWLGGSIIATFGDDFSETS